MGNETEAEPRVEACLAHAVLRSPDDWLGLSSPTAVEVFLAGAELRAATTDPTLPSWRIFGPLRSPDFDKPLVAKTGHPSLTIGWATALELIHFSMTDALAELKRLIEERFDEGRVSREPVASSVACLSPRDPTSFWRSLARRPGMYLGGESGWHLGWYLAGLTKGGDWLDLPPFPGGQKVADAIHEFSKEVYGSEFGGFRVYAGPGGVQAILRWAGIEPLGHKDNR